MAHELGMTVAQLRAGMSHAEYTQWFVYFGRRAQRQELAAAQAKGG